MSLPRWLAEKAIDSFAQKFIFVYKDHELTIEDILCDGAMGTGNKHDYYGVCTSCGKSFEYHDVGNVGGKTRITDVCPVCDVKAVVKKGWYGKKTLSDCFYLQAWEVLDREKVLLHEAIIKVWDWDHWRSYNGPKEFKVYDLRCTLLRPGKCESVRWNGTKLKWSGICSDYEASGFNITSGSNYYNEEPFVRRAEVMGLEALENTFLAPFARCVSEREYDPGKADFIVRMVEEPMTEILYKQGFIRIAEDRAHGTFSSHNTRHLCFAERSPKKFFRNVGKDGAAKITKIIMSGSIVRSNITLPDLEGICGIVQKRKDITPEQILELFHDSYNFGLHCEVIGLLPDFGIEKILNYLKKQAGATIAYRDYLSMCRRNGEDLSDSQVAFPKELAAAHDIQVKKIKILESKAASEKVAKRYRELVAAGYEYTYNGLTAVIPAKAIDIQNEGKALAHCVGRYIDSHMRGKTTIIFIRLADDPRKSYFTLEIDPKTFRFVQCYGYKNRSTGIKGASGFGQPCEYVPKVGDFLEHYKDHLMKNDKKEAKEKCLVTA